MQEPLIWVTDIISLLQLLILFKLLSPISKVLGFPELVPTGKIDSKYSIE